jgi:hypothetical protein
MKMGRMEHLKCLIFGENSPIFGKKGENSSNFQAIEESKSVRALKKHLGTMEEIIAAQDELLREYAKEARLYREVSIQDRLLDTAISIFAPSKSSTTHESPQSNPLLFEGAKLESGMEYNDADLKKMLDLLPEKQRKMLKISPIPVVKEIAKKHGFDISETSIKRAKELII